MIFFAKSFFDFGASSCRRPSSPNTAAPNPKTRAPLIPKHWQGRAGQGRGQRAEGRGQRAGGRGQGAGGRGQGRAGQAGQGRAGQGRAGQGRAGRAGQGRAGGSVCQPRLPFSENSSDRPRTDEDSEPNGRGFGGA